MNNFNFLQTTQGEFVSFSNIAAIQPRADRKLYCLTLFKPLAPIPNTPARAERIHVWITAQEFQRLQGGAK
ncbi:MAG: hypothetical protein ACOVSW_21085 [Candidatus Kapaibacteriota bacterium]